MKYIHNITTLLLAMTLALLLSACNTKTSQDETHTTGSSSPTTQTTGDTSVAGSGTTATATNNSGETTSNGSNDSSTGNSSNNTTIANTNTASNNTTTSGGDNDDNATTDGGTDDNVTTGGNDDNATTGGGDDNTTTTPTDTVPPVITLNGEANMTLDQDTPYTELGATALDAVDGNVSVTISGTVDTSTIGSYTIVYTAQDSAGNEANITRSITVIDVTPPVITLNGQSTITLEQDAAYTELGANALDAVDGNVSVTISGNVDTSTVGSYTVTYSAKDGAGNEANITRVITVIDVIPPVITLNGEDNITLEQNAVYTELGATALDAVDGNVSVSISGTVDTSTVGNYTVIYMATDSAGNEANTTRTINIIDVTPPVITLNGEANITLEQNTAYTELGATALDVVDGNVSVNISGNVDTSTVGNYTVTYSAQDTSGNEANITRTITIIDVTPPVITFNGEANITLEQNDVYTELGATALDGVDGNVSVSISGTVDTSTVGNYTVTYTATDSAGNEANITRSVEVINVTPTLSSLSLESNATTVNVGETVQLSVVGTYSDNSTNIVDENITYIITPVENAEVNGSVLTALKDGNVTVQAKVGTTISNTIILDITWVVDGHTLPPEPDKALNDSTLLGIDTNNNGVRDDVERWIYEEYKDKHPIHIDIAMQAAKGYKLVLEHPEKAKEIHNIVSAPVFCEGYFRVFADMFGDTKYIQKRILDTQFETIYFNTPMRNNTYLQYQQFLSGDSYTVPWASEGKNFCDFDLSKF